MLASSFSDYLKYMLSIFTPQVFSLIQLIPDSLLVYYRLYQTKKPS